MLLILCAVAFAHNASMASALILNSSVTNELDKLLVVCQSIANPAVQQEYGLPTPKISGIPLASQVGLLVGAGIWGFSADVIGRKLAFNTSLFSCAIFVLIAGGMPSYISFAAMLVPRILLRCQSLRSLVSPSTLLELEETTF